MSMWVIIAGYALCLLANIIACCAIAHSKHAVRGLSWLIAALSSALVAVLLYAVRPHLSFLICIVLSNLAIFLSFALLHQSIAVIIDASRRHTWVSLLLGIVLSFVLLYFTYPLPSARGRVLARTAAVLIQVIVSVTVLFRQKHIALRGPIHALAGLLLLFSLLQIGRLVATIVWTPIADPFHPDPAQAFFSLINYILGLGSALGVIWLAVCAQRDNLHVMATTDELSGLLNRRAFLTVLERELQPDERRQGQIAVLLIDLDHFKSINDDYGHQVGDEVIRRVGQLLWINTREMDAVARYGGEEFVMLLKRTSLEQAESIAERLRTQIEAMAGLPEPIRITASIGIAMKNPDDTAASILKRSDEALYVSKRAGRNRISTHYVYAEY